MRAMDAKKELRSTAFALSKATGEGCSCCGGGGEYEAGEVVIVAELVSSRERVLRVNQAEMNGRGRGGGLDARV